MIAVQNIYHMLSYAFQVLNEQGYKDVMAEEFNNAAELCAAILIKGVSVQLKRGLGRVYISQTEALTSLHGKIDLSASVREQSIQRRQLICDYDDFSVNSELNQAIKATMELLLRSDITKRRKKDLKKLLVFFKEVDSICVYDINWNIQYNRNNQTYRMLIAVCFLVVKGLLQSQTDGTIKLMDFLDEQRMYHLYERFILEYYRKEWPVLTVNASQISWQLDDGFREMLPKMQTDIMLSRENRILIIDAKYYEHAMQVQYGLHTLHSHNMYQIFTYVKNKDYELRGRNQVVSGMLLYAKTDEEVLPNGVYRMSGNQITVRTLDLNCDFGKIKEQLDTIVKEHFGLEYKTNNVFR